MRKNEEGAILDPIFRIRILARLAVVVVLVFLIGCTSKPEPGQAGYESAVQGDIVVKVDPEIRPLLDGIQPLYVKENPKANITFSEGAAADLMFAMLNHSERIAVVARDYTSEERQMVSDAGADTLPRALVAVDALVAVVPKTFPYDTMNAEDIRGWLSGNPKILAHYPKLKSNPQFIVAGGSSGSIYGNVVNVVMSGKQPAAGTVVTVGTRDSVKMALQEQPGTRIGFGYLSQYVRDTSIKLLRLSYTDSVGQHVWPKPVHSSYLMMRKYPFPVPIYVYLKRPPNPRDLPGGYMQFITRSRKAQKFLFDWGIEPGYAKITLYKED